MRTRFVLRRILLSWLAGGMLAVSSMGQYATLEHSSTGLYLNVAGLVPSISYSFRWSGSLDASWGETFADGSIWSDGQGMVDVSIPQFFRLNPVQSINEFVMIPAGTNSGTNPIAAGEPYEGYWSAYPQTYNLEISRPFWMGCRHVTNEEVIRIYQWGMDTGRLLVNTRTIINLLGESRELLDMDDFECELHLVNGRLVVESDRANLPCVEISAYGAMLYCNLRSELEGLEPCYDQTSWSCDANASGFRVPTETEWEYAARGGLRSRRYPWGDTVSFSNANYECKQEHSYDVNPTLGPHPLYIRTIRPFSSPAGAFPANGYGLYDMAGNAQDWCINSVDSTWVRGGAAESSAQNLRTGYRISFPPHSTDSFFGFRVVKRVP